MHFQKLASGIDVSGLARALSEQAHLFKEITGRQEYAGSAHKDTECIFLRWCKGLAVDAAFTEIPAFDYPAMGHLKESHALINFTLKCVSAIELGRVLITSLKPGGFIAPHADEGAYADHYERFHVVVEAEDRNHFICDDEEIEMKTGELWWFDHKRVHSVHNNSDQPRVHLIIDAVAPAFRRERVAHAV